MDHWEKLNAYMDGELDSAEAAALAQAIAADPHLAAQLARLRRLKQATAQLSPNVSRRPDRRARVHPARRWAPAAVLFAFGFAILGWWYWPNLPQEDWLDQGLAAHRAWLEADSAQPQSGAAFSTSARQWDFPDIPDLTPARLSLAYIRVHAMADERHSLFLGYEGIHGCRVGLWIGEAAAELGEQPVEFTIGETVAYGWRHGPTAYAFLARGMARERMRALADGIAKLTQPATGMGEEQVRLVLHQAGQVHVPCRA